jgi:hypothetical protein
MNDFTELRSDIKQINNQVCLYWIFKFKNIESLSLKIFKLQWGGGANALTFIWKRLKYMILYDIHTYMHVTLNIYM